MTDTEIKLKIACNKLSYLIKMNKIILPDAYYKKLWQRARAQKKIK